MGHANSEETFQSIQAVHSKLDLTHNLVQVSTDGSNMNWKTVEIIKNYREHDDPDGPDLLTLAVVNYMLCTVLMEQHRKLQTGILISLFI